MGTGPGPPKDSLYCWVMHEPACRIRGEPLACQVIECCTHLAGARQQYPKRSLKVCKADQWQRLTPVQGPPPNTPTCLLEALRKHSSIVCGLQQCDGPRLLAGEPLHEGMGIARTIRTDHRSIEPQLAEHLSKGLCGTLAHGGPSKPARLSHQRLACERLLLQGLSTGRAGGRKPPGFIITREKRRATLCSPGLEDEPLGRRIDKPSAILEQARHASSAKSVIRLPQRSERDEGAGHLGRPVSPRGRKESRRRPGLGGLVTPTDPRPRGRCHAPRPGTSASHLACQSEHAARASCHRVP